MTSPRSRRLGVFLSCVSLLCQPMAMATARVQPSPTPVDLLSKVPETAVGVLVWSGARGEAYSKSKLNQLLESPGFQAVWKVHVPSLLGSVSDDDSAPQMVEQFLGAVKLFASRPLAVYFEPPTGMASGPRLVAMVDGSDDPEAVEAELKGFVEQSGPVGATTYREGELFYLVSGSERAPKVDKAIRASERFIAAMKQVGGAEGQAVAFFELESLISNAAQGDEQFKTIMDATGLGGVRSVAYAGRFDAGGEYLSQGHIAVNGEPKGVLKSLLAARTEPSPLLKRVPADSVYMGSLRVGIGEVIESITRAVTAVQPNAAEQINVGFAAASAAVGADVRLLLTKQLGPEFLVFEPAAAGRGAAGGGAGSSAGGTVYLVQSSDAPAALVAVDSMVAAAQRFLLMGGAEAGVRLERAFETVGDTRITTVALKLPDTDEVPEEMRALVDYKLLYTQKDGMLVFTTGREAMLTALTPPTADITTSAAYQAALKRLDAPVNASVEFIDLPRTVVSTRQQAEQWMKLLQLIDGELEVQPLLKDLFEPAVPLLTPSIQARWSDGSGYHFRSASPFPGAEAFSRNGGTTSVMVAAPALAIGVALPSVVRARETAVRVRSASNLRQLGMGMVLHANDERGKFPDDLGQLLLSQDLSVELFVSPRTSTEVPESVRNGTPQDKALWVTTESDFVYLGKGLTSSASSDVVVAHERLDRGIEDGVNVLYADGRVEFILILSLPELLKASDEARGK